MHISGGRGFRQRECLWDINLTSVIVLGTGNTKKIIKTVLCLWTSLAVSLLAPPWSILHKAARLSLWKYKSCSLSAQNPPVAFLLGVKSKVCKMAFKDLGPWFSFAIHQSPGDLVSGFCPQVQIKLVCNAAWNPWVFKAPLAVVLCPGLWDPLPPHFLPTPAPTLSDLILLLPLRPQLRQLPLALCSPAPLATLVASTLVLRLFSAASWLLFLLFPLSEMLLPGYPHHPFLHFHQVSAQMSDYQQSLPSLIILPFHSAAIIFFFPPLIHGCLSSYVCLYLCLSSPYSIVSSVRTLGSLLQHLEQCLTHRLNSTSIGSWRTWVWCRNIDP